MSDPSTGQTTYAYDELNRLTQISGPGTVAVNYRYDADGNRRRIIYSDGTPVDYEYDNAGRLKTVRDWRNREVQYTYFQDNSLRQAFNATVNGTATQRTYDGARRLTQIEHLTDPLGQALSQHAYTLDLLGNRTHLDEFVPDSFFGPGALLGSLPTAQNDLETAGVGDLRAAGTVGAAVPGEPTPPTPARPLPLKDHTADADAAQTHEFEAAAGEYRVQLFAKASAAADIVVRHPTSGATLGFALNGTPSLRSRQGQTATAQVGTTTVQWITYHDRVKENVILAARPAGDQIGFSVVQTGVGFVSDGRGGYRARDNHGITRFHVLAPTVNDATGRKGKATLSLAGGSATIQIDSAFLSAAVFPVTVDPQIHFVVDYTYDGLARLTSATLSLPFGWRNVYQYDPAGNRRSWSNPAFDATYSYDRADRLQSVSSPVGSLSYTFNANGNLICRGGGPSCADGDSFTYDQANRQTSATVGGTTSSVVYDGDGKRLSLITPSDTNRYVYDANWELPVVLEDGNNKYVWGLGLAFMVHPEVDGTETVSVFHADALGSVRVLTDGTGRPIQTYQTDEFGNGLPQPRTQPFGFTGEQQDPSGLVYLRARVYDPQTGRFLQRDTLGKTAKGITGWNRYAYAANNPTTVTDPSGHCPPCVIPVAIVAAPTISAGTVATIAAVTAGAAIVSVVAVDAYDHRDEIGASVSGWWHAQLGKYDEPPTGKRPSFTAENSQQNVRDRSGGECIYCESTEKLRRDHVEPWDTLKEGAESRGEEIDRYNDPENIRSACEPCNSGKKNRNPVDWLEQDRVPPAP
jgi:RHS repeat-associated protein